MFEFNAKKISCNGADRKCEPLDALIVVKNLDSQGLTYEVKCPRFIQKVGSSKKTSQENMCYLGSFPLPPDYKIILENMSPENRPLYKCPFK